MIAKLKIELNHSRTFLSFTFIKLLGQLVTFILPLTIAKILSPEGFGSYSLSIMIVFFFTSVFVSSFQTPFIVYANEENKRYAKINKAFSVQLLFLLISIIFFIILTFVFGKYITDFAKISSFQLVFLFLAYLGIGLNSFFQNIFLALNKRIDHSLYFLINGVANLIFLFIFYYQNNLNLNTIFLIYFFSSIVSFVIFLNKIEFNKLFPIELDKKLFLEMFHWTKWQVMGLTAVYFINWGDNLVLRHFVSIEEIGVYNLGYQIFKGLISLTYIFNIYFIPFISQNIHDAEKMRNYFNIKRPKIILIWSLGIVIIFIYSPYLLNLIYGDVYREAATVLRILLIANVISLLQIFYIPIINSLKEYKFAAVVNVVQISVNILLDIILVYFFGFIGAAWATVVAYFLSYIVYVIKFKKINYGFV